MSGIDVCPHDQLKFRQTRPDRFDQPAQRTIQNEGSRPRMLEDVADLLARKPHVDRHQNATHLRDGEMRLERLQAVPAQYRNPIPYREPTSP